MWQFWWLLAGWALFAQASPAGAQALWPSTRLAALSFDGMNSHIARGAARLRIELSGGDYLDLKDWYSPKHPNLSAAFTTQISENLSLFWGGSFGEVGQKYRIGPALSLGLMWHEKLSVHTALQVGVFGIYGGAVHEQACSADYGAFGGVSQVNCRLAATVLSPEETLSFLWDSPPSASAVLQITYQVTF